MNSKSLLTLAAAMVAFAVILSTSSTVFAQGGIGGSHGGAAGVHPNHANASGFHKDDSWHVHEGGNHGYQYHYNPSVGYYRPYVAQGYYGGYGYRNNWNLGGYARSTSPALAAYSNMRNGAYNYNGGYARSTSPALAAYSNMRNGSYGYNYGYPYQYGPAVPQRPYFPPDPFGNPATSVGADPNSRGAAQERLNQELNKEE
ncbi:MAG: hypothetical protein MK106_02965 [Mariniblastus sp.]|nr:hypothetical protein [Mariniblastus sp.]